MILVILAMSAEVSGFMDYYLVPLRNRWGSRWWRRPEWRRYGYPYYSYWAREGFQNAPINPHEKQDPIIEYPPDSPAPANLSIKTPYHLLGNEIPPPRVKESISCVNSRSCYATDFSRIIEKTGNYTQYTNNYKRGYPDSCSAPTQELVLNFYKTDPIYQK